MNVLKPQVLTTSDNWFNRHKTKLLGLAIITINYLQLPANAAVLQSLLSETGFVLLNMFFGLLALWFGFLNPQVPPPPNGGSAGSINSLAAVGIAVLATMLLSSCAYLQGANPVKPAVESGKPELIAFALEGSYTIVQGEALEFARAPTTPPAAKDVIIRIDERAGPIFDRLRPLAVEAESLRAFLEECDTKQECDTTSERLARVLPELNRLITEVSPLINDLLAAIKGDSP